MVEKNQAVATLRSENKGFLLGLVTQLVCKNIPFTYEDNCITVSSEYYGLFQAEADALTKSVQSRLEVITDTDSEEQSGSYANGTLSNIAPGLAVTVQVHPAQQIAQTEESLKSTLPQMFYPLIAQGWDVVIVLGEDIDTPA